MVRLAHFPLNRHRIKVANNCAMLFALELGQKSAWFGQSRPSVVSSAHHFWRKKRKWSAT